MRAFVQGTNVETCSVYAQSTWSNFDWRITIESTYTDTSFDMLWEYEFLSTPDGDGDGIGDCDFTYLSMSIEYPDGTLIDMPVTFGGILRIDPGVTVINYVVEPSDGTCVNIGSIVDQVCLNIESCNCNAPYISRFFGSFLEVNSGISSIGPSVPTPGDEEHCSAVCLRYGCPAALKDGFCLEASDVEANDILESELAFHTDFTNITQIDADVTFDSGMINNIGIELDNSIPASFTTTVNPTGPNSAHITISSLGSDTFDIGNGSTYVPLKVKGTLVSDLTDCFSFQLANFTITSSTGGLPTQSTAFIDPGIFCSFYDDNYEEAWITTTNGVSCASSSNTVTLTALGPFESQSPSVSYTWSTGETTQTIDVSAGGTYSVVIDDENGCIRQASVTLDTCPQVCECGDLNPQVQLELDGCQVQATVLHNDCNTFTNMNYHWEFSNGNEYDGLIPPPQSNTPNGGFLSAKVIISYTVPGELGICTEDAANEIFIPCRSSGKDGLTDGFKVYPNPAKDKLVVSIDDNNLEGGYYRDCE